MFFIITLLRRMYIIITVNICRYYKECISHLKVIFVLITEMYFTTTGNVCHYYRNVYLWHAKFTNMS